MPILNIFATPIKKRSKLAQFISYELLCVVLLSFLPVLIDGSLNDLIPQITMLFLQCYFCINMSCFIQELVDDPQW
jgi:hypothetical protein